MSVLTKLFSLNENAKTAERAHLGRRLVFPSMQFMNAEYPNPVGEPNRERVELCPEWTGKKGNQISLLSLLVTCTWLYSKGLYCQK